MRDQLAAVPSATPPSGHPPLTTSRPSLPTPPPPRQTGRRAPTPHGRGPHHPVGEAAPLPRAQRGRACHAGSLPCSVRFRAPHTPTANPCTVAGRGARPHLGRCLHQRATRDGWAWVCSARDGTRRRATGQALLLFVLGDLESCMYDSPRPHPPTSLVLVLIGVEPRRIFLGPFGVSFPLPGGCALPPLLAPCLTRAHGYSRAPGHDGGVRICLCASTWRGCTRQPLRSGAPV